MKKIPTYIVRNKFEGPRTILPGRPTNPQSRTYEPPSLELTNPPAPSSTFVVRNSWYNSPPSCNRYSACWAHLAHEQKYTQLGRLRVRILSLPLPATETVPGLFATPGQFVGEKKEKKGERKKRTGRNSNCSSWCQIHCHFTKQLPKMGTPGTILNRMMTYLMMWVNPSWWI